MALMTAQSVSRTVPQTTLAHDVFRIYDDNSAIVESKHGTFYDLQFFCVGGHYRVTECGCQGSEKRGGCRHRRELAAELAICERWPDAEVTGLQDDDRACPAQVGGDAFGLGSSACGGRVVKAVVWSAFGGEYRGVLVKRVCEKCGVLTI